MARMTKKYTAALSTGHELGINTRDREELYQLLIATGRNWDGKAGTWSENNPYQGSVFEDFRGQPTGAYKIRLMAHPDEVDDIIDDLRDALEGRGYTVGHGSEKYPNRKGVGVRVYIEGWAR